MTSAVVRQGLIRHGPTLGLAGVGVAIAASLVTAIAYSGPDDEPYSPLNHTVSELGERGVSELAPLFNVALLAGGLLIALYLLSLALRATAHDRAGFGFGLLGTAAGIAMALVGLFPVDDLEPHIAVAAVAFGLIFVASLWFAVWRLRGAAPYPRWLGIFALVIAIVVVVFLFLPGLLQPEYRFEMDFTEELPRPRLLWNSALEWLVISLVWLWIAGLGLYDRGHMNGGQP